MEKNSNNFKLLICGDVVGNYKLLAKKLTWLNVKKGPFKFCLCMGQFFDPRNSINEQLNNAENANLFAETPIYVFDETPKDFKLTNSKNITIVDSNSGILETIEGFRIIYVLKSNQKEIEKLIDVVQRDKFDVKGVDFLISDWPFGIIDENDELEMKDISIPKGDKLLSCLALKTRPRYHLAAREGIHYQRRPYQNTKMGPNDHKPLIATRFLSLAQIAEEKVTKSFHALSIVPINKMSLAETVELQKNSFVSKNPYSPLGLDECVKNGSGGGGGGSGSSGDGCATTMVSLKSKTFHDDLEEKPDRDDNEQKVSLSKIENVSGSVSQSSSVTTATTSTTTTASATSSSSHQNFKKIKKEEPMECWFCIGNEKVEKHYIVHIKDHMYLTRAKGGLTYDHMIITSLQHYKSTLDLPDFVVADLQSYKQALVLYYQSKNHVVVFYERNFRSSHIQIHAIPVPMHKANNLIPVFHNLCKEHKLNPMKISALEASRSAYPNNLLYFYIELPSDNFIIQNLPNNFKIFFGRLILGHPNVLNKQNRINWRTCVNDIKQEIRFTDLMKTQLKNFLSL